MSLVEKNRLPFRGTWFNTRF